MLPHFGGMEFRHSPEALCPYGGAPFWEAPVTTIEKMAWLWGLLHNPEFQPYYAYFKWSRFASVSSQQPDANRK